MKRLSENELEELLVRLEKELSNYLEKTLPPKTDFNLTLSIVKKDNGVDVLVEVDARGQRSYHGDLRKLVQDAVNYAKKKIVELLNTKKQEHFTY